MREDWKEYIAFSRKERNGVIILLILIVIAIAVPWFFPEPEKTAHEGQARAWSERLALWKEAEKRKKGKEKQELDKASAGRKSMTAADPELLPETAGEQGSTNVSTHYSLFAFDPNTLQASGWQRLGIPDKVIRTIFNYINKGGRFRKPEDLGKIYGMRATDAKRLLPFVKIAGVQQVGVAVSSAKPSPGHAGLHGDSGKKSLPAKASLVNQPYRKKRYIPIDVNAADTIAWSGFPGIGSKLANRIVAYREKLGGFHSIDQVGETYALPDSTFQQIRPWLQCAAPLLRKIRINEAGVEELKQHPYLRWNLANVIVQFRQQHGAFKSAADLQSIILLTPLLITRIAPYLEY